MSEELVKAPEPSVASMLQAVIDRGITAENVAALEQLVGLYERMQAKDAEREYNAAFARLQSELPQVEATKPVPNRDGTIRYRFAPFEEIMSIVQPFLTKNGFSVSFDTRFADERVSSICTLRHTSGHSQRNEFAVRIGQGPPSASEPQADGSAKTYAKRGALSDALNIVIEHDDDARMVGKPIGKALAEDLQSRVKACGANEEAFLKFAGAVDYESISDERYEALDTLLRRKERINV
jgi:ERF superfamily